MTFGGGSDENVENDGDDEDTTLRGRTVVDAALEVWTPARGVDDVDGDGAGMRGS